MRQKLAQSIQDKVIDAFIEKRKKLAYSHEKLASLAGLHRTAISHIENRRRNPTLVVCLKIADALNCQFSEILNRAESSIDKK